MPQFRGCLFCCCTWTEVILPCVFFALLCSMRYFIDDQEYNAQFFPVEPLNSACAYTHLNPNPNPKNLTLTLKTPNPKNLTLTLIPNSPKPYTLKTTP